MPTKTNRLVNINNSGKHKMVKSRPRNQFQVLIGRLESHWHLLLNPCAVLTVPPKLDSRSPFVVLTAVICNIYIYQYIYKRISQGSVDVKNLLNTWITFFQPKIWDKTFWFFHPFSPWTTNKAKNSSNIYSYPLSYNVTKRSIILILYDNIYWQSFYLSNSIIKHYFYIPHKLYILEIKAFINKPEKQLNC